MNSIDKKFRELAGRGDKALMPYFTAGFPSLEETVSIACAAEEAGADMLELGVPFSDPVADGPIIQYSSFKALESGVNQDRIFKICGTLKRSLGIPYLLMTYYNPVYRYGVERFFNRCCETGVSGLIIPDLPYEEAAPAYRLAGRLGISLIQFISLTTDDARADKIAAKASGFLYFVTVAGVTGPREGITGAAVTKMKSMKKRTGMPLAAGFGISGTSQIKRIKPYADGIIVGSLFTKYIIDDKMGALWETIRRFKEALI